MGKKSILITGCSSGIGLAAAEGLRAAGWQVFAACRKDSDRQKLASAGFETVLLDYSDPATIRPALDQVLEKTGGTLGALFNNGAYALPGAVEDIPTDGLRAIFEANVFGWHELTRLVIPVMRAQGSGRIINNSSVLGIVAAPWRGAYTATKFALEGLTDTLRLEMRDTPIRVVLIEPGPVTSRIRVNSIPHFEKWIDWENSPRAGQYRTKLLKRLYDDRAPDRFELPAASITPILLRALETPTPKPRYYLTKPTHIMGTLRRMLPTRALDWILAKG